MRKVLIVFFVLFESISVTVRSGTLSGVFCTTARLCGQHRGATINIRLLTILIFAITTFVHAQVDWRIGTPVDLYQVRAMVDVPVLDGKLDDKAWEDIEVTDRFYDYMAPTKIGSYPPLSTIRTVMRVGKTSDGLWLGFDCFEDMSKIKADIVARDNADIWREPCLELFFGQDWRHTDYRKFTINILATQADRRRLKGADDGSWNDMSWQAATHRYDDRWTAELFFPWSSLNRTLKDGDMLTLGVTRFSWTTGKIVGACWGAAMSNPYIYRGGQLLIEDDLISKITGLAEKQERWRGDTWHMWLDDRMVTVTTLDAEMERVNTDARRLFAEIDVLAADVPLSVELAEKQVALREKFDELLTHPANRNTWAATAQLKTELESLRDRLRVQRILKKVP